MTKGKTKDVHFYTTESRYIAMAKAAIDHGQSKAAFMEAALDHYLESLSDTRLSFDKRRGFPVY